MTTVSKIKRGRPSREEQETSLDITDPTTSKKVAEYYPLMNKRMKDWVVQAEKRNVQITSAILQERAKVVADSIGWTSFRASSGWCVKFLRRNNIKLRELKRQAKLKSACKEGTKWEHKILNPRLDADGMVVDADTSDSEDAAEHDFMDDSDSEDEDALGGRNKVPSLESAKRAWELLQEWFIAHPPKQERFMQAVFIINKEMMTSSFEAANTAAAAATAAPANTSSAGAPLPLPVTAAPESPSADLQQQQLNALAKLPKKRQQVSAALPVNAAVATAAVGNNTFFQSTPSVIR